MTQSFSRAGNLIWEAGSWAVFNYYSVTKETENAKTVTLPRERLVFIHLAPVAVFPLCLSVSLFLYRFEIRLERLPYCREERS